MERDYTTKFIGLNVHSKTISVVIADEGRTGEVRHYGTSENTTEPSISHRVTCINRYCPQVYIRGCPCGFALYRHYWLGRQLLFVYPTELTLQTYPLPIPAKILRWDI